MTQVLFVVLFALLGLTTLVLTRAATPTASIEPETGVLSGGASMVTSADASGGNAVKFTASGTSGNCPAFPAFPDHNCTGVPAGYAQTTVSGDFTTTSNGQVVDGKLITGDLNLEHNNVTVTNTRIKGMIWGGNHTGLTLRNVNLGPDQCSASAGNFAIIRDADGYTIIQSWIHHNPADLLQVGGGRPVVIRDSILDSTCYYPGAHLDVLQYYDPGQTGNVTLIHNIMDSRVVNVSGLGNAAIQWGDGPGPGTVLTAYNNKFAGGNFTTQLGDATPATQNLIDFHDNIYVKDSYQYGPCTSGNSSPFNGTWGLKFVNNKLDDGTPVSC